VDGGAGAADAAGASENLEERLRWGRTEWWWGKSWIGPAGVVLQGERMGLEDEAPPCSFR